MKSRLFGAVCAFTLTVLSTTINASLVVPTGLNPGDNYHVIFVSSTTTDATSSNITDYDAHVQAAADAAGIGAGIGLSWLAVGSTSTVDAIDHIAPLFSSLTDVPIYNQNGELVAAKFTRLWGLLANPVRYDENGLTTVLGQNNVAWTGTSSNGLASVAPLGGGVVTWGNTWASEKWLDQIQALGAFTAYSVYGISAELVVPAAVPIPAAVWLFGSGLLGLIGIAKRRDSK